MVRSSASPSGRPISVLIFCCSCPACTLARFCRCRSPSESVSDSSGCARTQQASGRCSAWHLCSSLLSFLDTCDSQPRQGSHNCFQGMHGRQPASGVCESLSEAAGTHLLHAGVVGAVVAAVVRAQRGAVGVVAALRLLLRKGRRRRRPIPPERRLQQRLCAAPAAPQSIFRCICMLLASQSHCRQPSWHHAPQQHVQAPTSLNRGLVWSDSQEVEAETEHSTAVCREAHLTQRAPHPGPVKASDRCRERPSALNALQASEPQRCRSQHWGAGRAACEPLHC